MIWGSDDWWPLNDCVSLPQFVLIEWKMGKSSGMCHARKQKLSTGSWTLSMYRNPQSVPVCYVETSAIHARLEVPTAVTINIMVFWYMTPCSLLGDIVSEEIIRFIPNAGTLLATDENIIRRMRFACWIIMATDTLIICNTYCFSTAIMVTRTRLKVTLYVHCVLLRKTSVSTARILFHNILWLYFFPQNTVPQ
jgi:hypothetical protein